MALFVDWPIVDLSDLKAYDAAIVEVAELEGVDLELKLRAAWEEIRTELEEFLARRMGREWWPGCPGGVGLEQLVVTPPLKQWFILRTLELVYADVAANRPGERYKWKLEEHRRRSKWASDNLFRIGLGFVSDPVRRATLPAVEARTGGRLEAGVYYVRLAWVNGSGQRGAPSLPVALAVPAGGAIFVQPRDVPVNVVGYDVFCGRAPEETMRQNRTALPAERVFLVTDLVSGPAPGEGQVAEWFLRNDRVVQRG